MRGFERGTMGGVESSRDCSRGRRRLVALCTEVEQLRAALETRHFILSGAGALARRRRRAGNQGSATAAGSIELQQASLRDAHLAERDLLLAVAGPASLAHFLEGAVERLEVTGGDRFLHARQGDLEEVLGRGRPRRPALEAVLGGGADLVGVVLRVPQF
jgi:hypothetical protein